MIKLNFFFFLSFINSCFLFINNKFFFIYKFSFVHRSLISSDTLNLLYINKILSRGGLIKPFFLRINS